jgi:hypothetical protein
VRSTLKVGVEIETTTPTTQITPAGAPDYTVYALVVVVIVIAAIAIFAMKMKKK